jgi:hypothetical protein
VQQREKLLKSETAKPSVWQTDRSWMRACIGACVHNAQAASGTVAHLLQNHQVVLRVQRAIQEGAYIS